MQAFKQSLDEINKLLKASEGVASTFKSQLDSMVGSLSSDQKRIYDQFAKESSAIINDKEMNIADKLNKINSLKDRYANGSSNK